MDVVKRIVTNSNFNTFVRKGILLRVTLVPLYNSTTVFKHVKHHRRVTTQKSVTSGMDQEWTGLKRTNHFGRPSWHEVQREWLQKVRTRIANFTSTEYMLNKPTLILQINIPIRLCSHVAVVEMMHTHETVFTSRCVTCSFWVDSNPAQSETHETST